ncbi:DNA cytosine methyltransferase [Streptomyces virginiae]|uniref:DNA cytosine methyltransferase n=1 Tax=Streptomyces virginiae TaxID=1961 RepID=UPI00225B2BC5|nr:DNA cytosine methyltransferase [Streptomyces virginiae]MCX4959084.1 DNA cytosine methyltransferase [Streptomyces virginiae]
MAKEKGAKNTYGVPLERSDYLKLDKHKYHCEPEKFGEWVRSGYGKGKRLAVDLFSGAGGLSLGLERAGWTTAAAVDFDERARETHAVNFPGMSLCVDLGDDGQRGAFVQRILDSGAEIDIVAGGPPCQPFSRAGRSKIRHLVDNHNRDPHDIRKELWRAYVDVVEQLLPRTVLMENVPDMGLGDDFSVIRIIEAKLESLGYATQVRLVDAWNYRVPQHRKRLILLARRDGGSFTWDKPKKQTTLRDAIGDLPAINPKPLDPVGSRILDYDENQEPKPSPFAKEMRKKADKSVIHDHMTRRVRADDFKIFTIMDSKTLYSELEEKLGDDEKEFQRYDAEQFTDKYKKLDWNELSRTITAHIAKDGYWYIHPEEPRTLTVREAARIQTFPDRFRFAGTRSDAFRQIGNAVPPLLGEAAARVLLPQDAPVGHEATDKWPKVREELTRWAKEQRAGRQWYQFPNGRKMKPLGALVMAVLSGGKLHPSQLANVMNGVAGHKELTRDVYLALVNAAPTAAARQRLEDRLGPVVDKPEVWVDADSILDHSKMMGLKPAELALFRLLAGDDIMLVNQGALRVAARLQQNQSHLTNRLTEGRLNLIKLLGAGRDAPVRMAAIRFVGENLCRDKQPVCGSCPLSDYCPTRPQEDEGAAATFDTVLSAD